MTEELTFVTAALLALYHTSPGRGRVAPMEAMLMMDPPRPCFRNWGIITCDEWKIDLTLTVNTLSNSSSATSRLGFVIESA